MRVIGSFVAFSACLEIYLLATIEKRPSMITITEVSLSRHLNNEPACYTN